MTKAFAFLAVLSVAAVGPVWANDDTVTGDAMTLDAGMEAASDVAAPANVNEVFDAQENPQEILAAAYQRALKKFGTDKIAADTATVSVPEELGGTVDNNASKLAPTASILDQSTIAYEVVTTRNIQRGEIIRPGDLASQDGTGTPRQDFVGLQLKRSVRKGGAIVSTLLQEPILVERNEVVAMEYRAGGLLIKAEGRALDEGSIGDLVRVMNLGSRQTVTASVVSSGRVQVGG
ncbi:MAG: flagellar basal body P-ring formation chaperone FlgA [Pseudomonadota bacterium]